jgi:ABC-type nitrate/sulfonate/bicarbonate transport system substrate-binding protein
VFYVSTAYLSKNPRTVEALLRLLDRGVAFINANKAEASRILATEFKQTEAAMEDQVSAVKYGLMINDERVKEIQAMADLLLGREIDQGEG